MCCTLRGTTGDIMAADEGEALMAETVEECRKVAAAEGFDPGDKGIADLKGYPHAARLGLRRLHAGRPREGRRRSRAGT